MIRVIHISTVHSAYDVRIFYREARSLANDGYDVVVAAPADSARVHQGVHIVPLGKEGGSRWKRIARVFRAFSLMLREQKAILHLHDPELLLAAIIPSFLHRKLIFDVHEFYVAHIVHAVWIPRWLRGLASHTYDWLERWILPRFSGVVIAVESMRARYAEIIGDEQVALVRNFPCISPNDKQQALTSAHPLEGRPYIVHTGGASHLRSFHVMVEAAELLRRYQCDWPIVNIGEVDLSGYDPQQRSEFMARASAAGIHNLGSVRQEEAWRYCVHAEIGVIFLAPVENYKRALPIKLFEYWFFGLPVVAPDLGELASYIRRWGAGLLFSADDGAAAGELLLSLVRDPDLRARLARRASEAGAHFDFAPEARSLRSLYERINA
jgi:glycosyltransferase involved in cell wall biosynthesis